MCILTMSTLWGVFIVYPLLPLAQPCTLFSCIVLLLLLLQFVALSACRFVCHFPLLLPQTLDLTLFNSLLLRFVAAFLNHVQALSVQ